MTASHVRNALTTTLATLACATLAATADAAPTGGGANLAGGSTAPQGAYPFVAGIRDPGASRFFCTGSVVDAQWILTAAHCVDDRTSAEVVIGDTDLATTTDPAETRSVDRIVIHPNWGRDTGDRNDIAMLHLSSPTTIAPVQLGVGAQTERGIKRCVQQRMFSSFPYGPCLVDAGRAVGWGRTPASGSQTSTVLKHGTARIFDLGPRGFWRAKAGLCPGDSGSPLVMSGPGGAPVQMGVASYAQHGGGWFDWLVGDRCSTKGWDFYAETSSPTTIGWVRRTTTPPVVNPNPPTPHCPPYKPQCQDIDEL